MTVMVMTAARRSERLQRLLRSGQIALLQGLANCVECLR